MLFSTPPAFAAAQARLQQAHAFMEEEDLVRKDEEMDRIRASWETTRSYLKWLEFFWERAVAWRESRAAWSLDLVLEDPPREGADPSRVAFLVVRREPPRRLALAPPAPSLFDFGRGASASPVVVVVVVEIEQVVLTVVGGSGDVPAGRAKAPYVAVDVASAELAEGDAVRLQLCARGRHGFEVLAVAGPDGAAESFPDDGARCRDREQNIEASAGGPCLRSGLRPVRSVAQACGREQLQAAGAWLACHTCCLQHLLVCWKEGGEAAASGGGAGRWTAWLTHLADTDKGLMGRRDLVRGSVSTARAGAGATAGAPLRGASKLLSLRKEEEER